jgi:ABC-2 type transport system ATP-binding protein
MIVIERLTKRYGTSTVVDDVSFTCRPGTVTGFLGPNGAGKSTTLRMLCGLTRPTSGTATVVGVSYGQLSNPGRTVGTLLDAGGVHPGRTGRETLAIAAATLGVDRQRIGEFLERVGLSVRASRMRMGKYSLGMRQRLGIAQALLGEPRVLILDEPANGLDPEGILWMRSLLRDFADRGGTVLLSSHLLREIEAVADQLVVIVGGRVMACGAKTALLADSGVLVRAADRDALRRALAVAGLASTETADGALVVQATPESVAAAAAAAGVLLLELRSDVEGGLERLFMTLMAEQNAEATA